MNEVEVVMMKETIELVAKARTREDIVAEILKIFPNCNKQYLDTLSIGGLINELNESIKYKK